MADLLDRRDLSEGFRWLAAGIVFCAITPLLFVDVHPWSSLPRSTGEERVIWWVIGLATAIVVGKAIEVTARSQYGAYLRSRLFLASIGSVSPDTRRMARIGWLDITGAWARRFLFWTHVPSFCMRAIVGLLIEIANDVSNATGLKGTHRLNHLQSLVMFLVVSQPRTTEKYRGVEADCCRGLDLFLLFVTLGQAFLLVGIIGVCASIWSMHLGDATKMLKQGEFAVGALLAAKVAKIASGQAFEELLVCMSALIGGFVPSVSQPSDGLS